MFCKRTEESHRTSDRTRSGFSLVELMVVIVIIGLLAGTVTIGMQSYMLKSKQNVAKLEIAKIHQAAETFHLHHSRYPTSQEGIEILAEKTEDFPDGLLSKVPKDPWGNPYEYIIPGTNSPYEVLCYGADHREGGTGADKDITSADLTGEE